MWIKDVIDEMQLHKVTGDPVIGIDIGSRTGKGVLVTDGRLYTASVYTGINMQDTADELLEEAEYNR